MHLVKIYCIVVTYNGRKWIDKCFSSLLNSTIPLKILAIDNASTDSTPQIIKDKFPEVEVIQTGENLGFGKANNVGLRRTLKEKADYAFLLNQDAWVEEDTLEKLVQVAQENPILGLLSPIHLNGKGDDIDRNFQNYLAPNFTPEFYSDLFLSKTKHYYYSRYANAAAWLITNKCIETIGGFDPMFKHYGEDNDYINRLHSADLCLCIVPDAIIYHDRPQDGQLGEKYYANQKYTQALLYAKAPIQPRKHFLIRKIISDCFAFIFLYLGRNEELTRSIKTDLLTLKLINKVNKSIYQKLNV